MESDGGGDLRGRDARAAGVVVLDVAGDKGFDLVEKCRPLGGEFNGVGDGFPVDDEKRGMLPHVPDH